MFACEENKNKRNKNEDKHAPSAQVTIKKVQQGLLEMMPNK